MMMIIVQRTNLYVPRVKGIAWGPSINYIRIFSQFLDPPPTPLLHTVRI